MSWASYFFSSFLVACFFFLAFRSSNSVLTLITKKRSEVKVSTTELSDRSAVWIFESRSPSLNFYVQNSKEKYDAVYVLNEVYSVLEHKLPFTHSADQHAYVIIVS